MEKKLPFGFGAAHKNVLKTRTSEKFGVLGGQRQ